MALKDTWNDLPRQVDNMRRKLKSVTVDTRWLYKLDKPGQSTGLELGKEGKGEVEDLSLSELQKMLDKLERWKVPGRPPQRLSPQSDPITTFESEQSRKANQPRSGDVLIYWTKHISASWLVCLSALFALEGRDRITLWAQSLRGTSWDFPSL